MLIPSSFIKEEAQRIGFADCRIACVAELTDEAAHLHRWLDEGMNGGMDYMARNTDKRTHPALLMTGAQTVIVVAVAYHRAVLQATELPQIARYAYGEDYHIVLKRMLRRLLESIQRSYAGVAGRVFTDSAPVLEHAWAARSGLGWTGKHSLTIHPRYGSYIVLGELLIDAEAEPDSPVESHCGRCTRCMEACPTQAITAPYMVDARRCLSYQTIENKGSLDAELSLHGQLFGCDRCQEACPHNRKAQLPDRVPFAPNHALLSMSADRWLCLTENEFEQLAANSPLQRAGLAALQRNAQRIIDEKAARSGF